MTPAWQADVVATTPPALLSKPGMRSHYNLLLFSNFIQIELDTEVTLLMIPVLSLCCVLLYYGVILVL